MRAAGRAAKVALPELEALLTHEGSARVAELVWELGGSKEKVLACLHASLASSSGGEQEAACDVVCKLGPAAAPLAPLIVHILEVGDYDEKWAAVGALEKIGKAAKAAIPALERMLEHPSGLVSNGAASALKAIRGSWWRFW